MIRESKLIQLLRTLQADEFKTWEAFLQSPFFNTNKHILKLWKLLKPHHPELVHASLTKEKLYKRIFKDDYKDLKMRKLMSATVKLLEKYWVHTKVELNANQFAISLADSYYERSLYELFEKSYRAQIKTLASKPFKTETELIQLIRLHHRLFFNQNPLKKRTDYFDLEKATIYLREFNQQQSYFYASEWNNIANIYNQTIPDFIQQLNQQFSIDKPDTQGFILIYHLVNQLLIQPIQKTVSIYTELKKILFQQKLGKTSQNWLFHHLMNYTIRQARESINFIKEELELYQFGLVTDAFLYKGKIVGMVFINIIMRFCRLQRFDLADGLIDTHASKLPNQGKENYVSISKCFILFSKQEYPTCFHLLTTFYFKGDVIFELMRRGLQIRSAFECSLLDDTYQEIVLSLISNFDKYLNNNSTINQHKSLLHTNFNKALLTIFRWIQSESYSAKEVTLFEKKIKEEKYLSPTSKKWLLTHTNRLKQESQG